LITVKQNNVEWKDLSLLLILMHANSGWQPQKKTIQNKYVKQPQRSQHHWTEWQCWMMGYTQQVS